MSNVIAFPGPAGSRNVVTVHWTTIAFMPPQELEQRLADSRHWANPFLFGSVVALCASWLRSVPMTDAQAKAYGWASLAVARERAVDMLSLLDDHLLTLISDHAELCLSTPQGAAILSQFLLPILDHLSVRLSASIESPAGMLGVASDE